MNYNSDFLYLYLGRMSYRLKLLLAIVLIAAVAMTILTVNRLHLIRRFSLELITHRIHSIGVLLVRKSHEKIIRRDLAGLETIIEFAESQEDVLFVHISDYNDIVLVSNNHDAIGLPDPWSPERYDADSSRDLLVQHFPIHIEDLFDGTLVIGFSLIKIFGYLREALYWAIILDLLLLISVGLASWIMSGLLMKPLHAMKEASRKMAQGDFNIRLNSESTDVVGELADSMDGMALQLGDLTDNMHRKIDESTAELKKKNARLLELSREMAENNAKLMELDRLKNDFVAMASHEFRTPLTSIIGYAQTLQKLELDGPQLKRYLSIIEEQGCHLAHLVQNFLDVSKIETGVFHFKKSTFSLVSLINRTISAINGHNRIDIDIVDKLNQTDNIRISADINSIRQVIFNLLDNALLYSGPDKPIELHILRNAEGVTVSVRDFGPGLDNEYLPHLFEKFRRGSDNVSRKRRGSGLGLAICNEIIKAHGGRIWHEKPEDGGARFAFFLPPMDGMDEGTSGPQPERDSSCLCSNICTDKEYPDVEAPAINRDGRQYREMATPGNDAEDTESNSKSGEKDEL